MMRQQLQRVYRLVGLVGMLLGTVPVAAPAQATDGVNLQRATRVELTARVQQLEGQLAGARRSHAEALRTEIAELRQRLTDGDFRVGDRFIYTIIVDVPRSDTASVRDGLVVGILNLPDLPLKGVLRSEVQGALAAHVGRYMKNATVRTMLLTQLSIIGAVARPGFYWTAPDRPLTELIMLAGGPLPDADMSALQVSRGTRVLLSAKASRTIIQRGRTVEQADIRSGDEVRVPMKSKPNWAMILQLFFIMSSVFFAVVQFIQWYYSRQE